MAEKVNMPSQKKEKKKKRKKKLPSDFYDYNLLACTILLVSFGLIMLYSASAFIEPVPVGPHPLIIVHPRSTVTMAARTSAMILCFFFIMSRFSSFL